jgi:hypothetical protein
MGSGSRTFIRSTTRGEQSRHYNWVVAVECCGNTERRSPILHYSITPKHLHVVFGNSRNKDIRVGKG